MDSLRGKQFWRRHGQKGTGRVLMAR
jgi:hypothetical protein